MTRQVHGRVLARHPCGLTLEEEERRWLRLAVSAKLVQKERLARFLEHCAKSLPRFPSARMVERLDGLDEDRATAPNGADLKQVCIRAAPAHLSADSALTLTSISNPCMQTCQRCSAYPFATAWLLWCRHQVPPGSA